MMWLKGGPAMSKFGVGVGDDFPIGDSNGRDDAQPRDDREEFEEWKRRRDAHRAQREEWRRQRAEWHERKRAFKERVRQAARETFGEGHEDHRGDWRSGGRRHRGGFPFLVWPAVGLLIPVLIVATVIAIIAAVFKSPFVFLGLVALGVLFFAHRHHHRHHGDFRGHYYDFDLKPSRGPTNNGGAIVTPPPAAPAGK
jgi:hypothetical protein